MDDPAPWDLAKLVGEHHAAVYKYAYRLTGSVADAEDLTQQVFLTAQQKLAQLRSEETARAWLYTILRNCFIKSRQKRRPVPAVAVQLNVETIPAAASAGEAIDRERLQRALDELPERYRLVVAMFYYENLSYKEIAEKLELPIGTVMSRLARAKTQLRTYLFEPDAPTTAGKNQGTTKPRG